MFGRRDSLVPAAAFTAPPAAQKIAIGSSLILR